MARRSKQPYGPERGLDRDPVPFLGQRRFRVTSQIVPGCAVMAASPGGLAATGTRPAGMGSATVTRIEPHAPVRRRRCRRDDPIPGKGTAAKMST